MATGLPHFGVGEGWGQQSASQLNNLVDAVNLLLERTRGLGPAGFDRQSQYRPIKVVITAPIEEGKSAILVRKVRYTSVPPDTEADGSIEFDGADFVAYPDYGFRVKDFAGMEWEPDQPLETRATFLDAYRDQDTWKLRLPAVSTFWCTVREVRAPTDRWAYVQRVRQTDVMPWDGTFESIGDVFPAWCYPGTDGQDAQELVNPGGEIIYPWQVRELTSIDGEWWFSPYIPSPAGRVHSADRLRMSNCNPLILPGG